ncbi:hypothetical protein SDC9_173375 [bioreactor metagenome]|uniref:Uncharacterized protein n=1 Tax=bioreactor metagenome TaxID=1076179 RepID=A0A645GPS5_9ZZZZ
MHILLLDSPEFGKNRGDRLLIRLVCRIFALGNALGELGRSDEQQGQKDRPCKGVMQK